MEDLVAGFVERLPQQLTELRQAVNQEDTENLKRLAHQLKGAAGGYGFMPVSEQAAAVEASVREGRAASETKEAVTCLEEICARVRQGPAQGGPSLE